MQITSNETSNQSVNIFEDPLEEFNHEKVVSELSKQELAYLTYLISIGEIPEETEINNATLERLLAKGLIEPITVIDSFRKKIEEYEAKGPQVMTSENYHEVKAYLRAVEAVNRYIKIKEIDPDALDERFDKTIYNMNPKLEAYLSHTELGIPIDFKYI